MELKGHAFRGTACARGGELKVASSLNSASLAGELDEEGTNRRRFRVRFSPAAAAIGWSSVASAILLFSMSREVVAEGTGEVSTTLISSS